MSRRQRQGVSGILGSLLIRIWEFLSDNKKKVMPVILLICVLATIGIAIHANRVAAEQAMSDADKNESSRPSSFEVTQASLMQDAYPEINALIADYFDAYVSGNVAKLNSGLYRTLDEIETVTLEERAKYIQSVRNLTVYTKPGPVEDSWVAYAYTDVRYMGCEEDLPGMVAFYVCKDEDGTYYINADETTQSVKDYITAVNLQDDVVELYNRVNVEYADKLKEDQMFAELVAAIYAEIDESIGERLTGADAAVAAAEAANAGSSAADGEGDAAAGGEETPKEVKIRATTTVRVRKSDSTESEVLGKAEAGEEFVRISEQGNGWSKISFAGGAAFVKSEYFEVLDAEPAGIPVNTGSNSAAAATTSGTEASTSTAASTSATTGAGSAGTGASASASTGSSASAAAGLSNASTGRSTASTNASTAKSASSANASTGKSSASTGKSDASAGKSTSSASASTGKSDASGNASTGSTAKPITTTGKKTARNGVRMREEPNTNATILYTLYGGVQVEVTKIRDDEWSEVKYKGKKGYIKTEYLSD